ncbi:MAG TPA: ADOP family duplicated permease [Thermoanaerobaculia bacterium]
MSPLASLSRHIRAAARSLLRVPGFSLAVIATLTVVLGPGVALLSLVEQLYWRPLPIERPDELVVFDPPQGPFSGSSSVYSGFSVPMSYPEYERFASWRQSPFAGVAARVPATLALGFDGATEEVTGELVTGGYFDLLGVRAERGRLLTAEDDVTIGGHPVAALSWGAWQRRFGGDAGVVGKSITLNGHAFTILGVAARDFRSLELEFAPELWLPMKMKPVATPLDPGLDNPRSRWLNIVARLAPGIDLAAAEARANELYRRSSEEILEQMPSGSEDFRQRFVARHLTLLPAGKGRSDLRGAFSTALFAVLTLVGMLFVLACANLANLFLARATRQERDLTVRLALGASRRDLVARLLAEAAVLAAVATALGTAIALALPRWLEAGLPGVLAGLLPGANATLLEIVAAVAIVTTLGCGLLPALLASRGDIAARLRSGAAATLGGGRGHALRRMLVGLQVALSAAILVGAGLLLRTLDRLASRAPGYDTAPALSFSLDPRLTGLDVETSRALVDRVEAELAALPGVAAAARGNMPLLDDWVWQSSVEIEGREEREDDDLTPRFDAVSANYFRALGIPLRSGRLFTSADAAGARPVAIVNQELVRRFFDGGDAIGRVLTSGREPNRRSVTIVGVVGNILSSNLREEPAPFVLLPFDQDYEGSATVFYLRASGPPAALVESVRRRVAAIAPAVPVVDLRLMTAQVERSLGLERATAGLATGLGLLAALLSAVGLGGVLGYSVDARRREIALRSALGAAPARIGRAVLSHVALPVALGLVAGLATALTAVRWLASLLYGVDAHDPATFVLVTLALVLVASAAAALPTARALAIEPAQALRDE